MTEDRDLQCIQISTQAYCSALILRDIDAEIEKNPTKTIKDFRAERMSRSDVFEQNPDFKIINAGYIFSLAYAIMVVPHEAWGEKGEDFTELSSLKYFHIDSRWQIESLNEIPGHIRNSISHARFFIDITDGTITFKDQWTKNNKSQNFQASISSRDFYTFLEEFYKFRIEPALEALKR